MKIFNNTKVALETINLPVPENIEQVENVYPTLVSEYYLNLIDPKLGTEDPIYRQCLPDFQELEDTTSSFDPLAEEQQMPATRVIHRFIDRVVLLATGNCLTRCRFCFRKRTWASGAQLDTITPEELNQALSYLAAHPEIKEVLVTGGDPLTIEIDYLVDILAKISEIPNIEIIRLATRIPVVYPMAITKEKVEKLKQIPSLWLATHFNHPNEITPESMQAVARFVDAGIPIINQTVLLAGVNDNSATLEKLFRSLVKHRVKPHYLFHLDPVRGVRHFTTGIDKGLEILREFRPRLSSLAVPTFAIDLPEGGGKVALQPNYQVSPNQFLDIHEKKSIEYPK